jgi:hypothetical protein
MAVGNPDWNLFLMSKTQNISTKVTHMTMHNVRLIALQNALKVMSILPRLRRMQAGNDAASQVIDFIIVSAGLIYMNHKIYLEEIAVNVPQHMHQPSFNTASIHPTHNLQDANRSLASLCLLG